VRRKLPWITALGLACTALHAGSETLTIIAYNVESGGAQAANVAREIEAIDGVDIWGFSELASQRWLEEFERAAEKASGKPFGTIVGTTGKSDRPNRDWDLLALLYREDKLEMRGQRELHRINDRAHRSPLVAEFRLVKSEKNFAVVLNHLASGNAKLRVQQSVRLREWASGRSEPIVMIGDFNYRWTIGASDNDSPRGFEELTRGGVLRWVRPTELAHTWCGGARNLILDFVFVNAAAHSWSGKSDVIRADCEKSSEAASDHRPVRVVFQVSQ
jgi:endonuclease/exonuclease/phosphatase family metal-dependent hydrolase